MKMRGILRLLICCFVCVLGVQRDAHAWGCTDYTTDRTAYGCNCATGWPVVCTDTWYGSLSFCSCESCPSGYEMQYSEFSQPQGDWPYGTSAAKCVPSCSTSKSCSSSFSGYSGTYNECTGNQSSACSKSCSSYTSGGYTYTPKSSTVYYPNSCSYNSSCTTPCTSVANSSSTSSGTEGCTSLIPGANYAYRSYTNTCNGYYTNDACYSAGGSCNGCSSWTRTDTGTCYISSCQGGYEVSGNGCKACSDYNWTNSKTEYRWVNISNGQKYQSRYCTQPVTYSSSTGGSCGASYGSWSYGSWADTGDVSCNANYYKDGSSCSACNVAFTDYDTCSRSENITGGTKNYTSGTKSRTCYHQTSNAGSASSSQCTGTQSCGVYGSCSGGTHATTTCSAGYYKNSSNTCSECEPGYYCPGGTYNVSSSVAGREGCPDPSTHKPTSFPSSYYNNPTVTNISISGMGYGASAATQCLALMWVDTDRAWGYEYTSYNGSVYPANTPTWASVKAGYYLTDKAGCGSYAYYATVKSCPAGYYCPGKAYVECYAGNQSTVWTTNFGLESCPSNYSNSAAKSDDINDCYLTTSSGKYVATAGAGQTTCACGGYCSGGTTVYYNGTGGWTGCGTGKYNSSTGSSASSACSTAAAGYVANSSCSATACTGATYQDETGKASCKSCPTATSLASRVTGYWYWSSDGIQNSVGGCRADITENDSNGNYALSCAICNGDYGVDGSCGSGNCMASSPTACATDYYWANPGGNVWNSTVETIKASACIPVGTGYYSANGATGRTACTNKPSNSYYTSAGGGSNSCGWSCDANYYKNGSACSACPTAYPNSGAGSTAITSCYSGTKSRAWSGSQTACSAPNGCSSATCNSCSNAACDYVAYSNTSGNGDGSIKSGCSTNNASCQQTVKSVTAGSGYYVDGVTCPVCPTDYPNSSDGNSGGAAACYTNCGAGTYVSTANAACTNVGIGYYKDAHSVNYGSTSERNQCPVGLITIGYGTGADEEADCGRKLHVGNEVMYLRSVKKTTPSFNVDINNDGKPDFFGNMSTGAKTMSDKSSKSYKATYNGSTYYIYDDSKQ